MNRAKIYLCAVLIILLGVPTFRAEHAEAATLQNVKFGKRGLFLFRRAGKLRWHDVRPTKLTAGNSTPGYES